MNTLTLKLALAATTFAALSALTGCVAPMGETDGPEPTGTEDDALTSTVEHAVETSCSTSSVSGLSQQIIHEGRCLNPDAYEKLPSLGNLHLSGTVYPYLEKSAHDALVAALKAHPTKALHVNSMLRTIAQQYLVYRWYEGGHRCGIELAATPGNSNHETGLAFDTDDESAWRSILDNHGFRWFGPADTVHFDYVGSGATDHRGLDVKAFQSLWNKNHPHDKIAVDGEWGPATEARMKQAPASGFAIGPSCQ
jgi:hypothetical protein